ncbi:hypothetical protein GQ53DRAFT_741841 [Thozetella sp. PMI_491]|nr:hypothetical protein GQ53DRAFT_741841 [Thozetella sp. PMI_491]
MSSISLHPRQTPASTVTNALPQLLQTPSGLALLELQGAINFADPSAPAPLPIGRLDFPEYNPDALDPDNTKWMKRVYLYVGQHQRLSGEAKKLPKPVAVVRRKGGSDGSGDSMEVEGSALAEELEVVEIVKYKLVFSQRPEPVGTAT